MRCPRCHKTHYRSREKMCECGVIPNDFVRDAVKRIQESRESHQRWAAFLTEHPDEHQKYAETIQTKEEHQRIVREYNNVIACLTSILPREDWPFYAPSDTPRGER